MKKDIKEKIVLGVFLMVLGTIWLLANLGVLDVVIWDMWPLALIAVGVYVVLEAFPTKK